MKASQRFALWLMYLARRIGGGAFIWSTADITINGKWAVLEAEGIIVVAGRVHAERFFPEAPPTNA